MRALNRLLLAVTLILTILSVALPPQAVSAAPARQDATPITAALDSAVKPDAFPPNQPLTVRFSAPVDPESAPMPVLTDPYLAGEFAWSEGDTLLTFTPAGGFRPGTTYQVYLNPDLTSADGAVFDPLPQWAIKTLTAPRVQRIEPSSGLITNLLPTIELSFDAPMDPETVQSALSITPEVPFNTEWKGQKLSIWFLQPLQLGEHYQFTLAGTAANSQGIPLGQDVVWDYWVDPLRASVKVMNDQWIDIDFNYDIDRPRDPIIQIEPELAGELSWVDEDTARITFDTRMAAVSEYTVSFTGQFVNDLGIPFNTPEPVTFEPISPVRGFGPDDAGDDYINGQPTIWMLFRYPVDLASVEKAFTTTPSVKGEISWEENKLFFTPSEPYAKDTEVTVNLSTDAMYADGEPLLAEPFTWTFHVDQHSSNNVEKQVMFGQYGPNAQVLSAEGRKAVQFVNTSAKAPAIFTLYRIEPGDFASLYRDHFGMQYDYYYESDSQPPVDTSGLEKIKTWPVEKTDNIQETLLPDGTAPGTYLLTVGYEGLEQDQDQLFLVVTDYKLVLKRSGERFWVWATDFDENSVEGLHVRLYTSTGEVMREGETDADGIFSTSLPKDNAPMLVTAMDEDGNMTAAGFSSPWQGPVNYGEDWENSPYHSLQPAHFYQGYVYTERPIYQPGQTVYYKAILRGDDDVHYTVPDDAKPVSIRLMDARDNEVQTQELKLNDFGTVNGSFALGQGAMLGDYTIEAAIEGETFTASFLVQQYRKPEYKVDLTLAEDAYGTGDVITVDIDTQYFFGKPVANAKISAGLYELQPKGYDYWWRDVEFETTPLKPGDYTWIDKLQDKSGKADENGHVSLSFRSLDLAYSGFNACRASYRSQLRECYIGVEVTADDGSGQPVTASKAVRVYSSSYKLTLDAGGWRKSPGESFDVTVTAVDITGQPAAGKSVMVKVFGYSNHWREKVITTLQGKTGADGKLVLPVQLDNAGYYQINLSEGNRGDYYYFYETNDWVYVSDRDSGWSEEFSEFKIEAERIEYKPYEKAKLLITSAFDGPALLTFERGQVIHTKPVMLTAPLTEVEVEIIPEDAPNVFVKVNAWQGEYQTLADILQKLKDNGDFYFVESLRDARLYQAQVQLIVDAGANRLNIAIQPEKEQYGPREEASLTVKVTDAQERPVQAELSVALVDEAIFSLSDDRSGSIFDAFYSPRRLNVHTYDSLALERYLFYDAGGQGGGGDGGILPPNPRGNFQDTALWLPDVRTDENGVATVQVTLPDNLTSWRVIVKAVTVGTKVGEATTNIITQNEAIVRPMLPQELVVGDTVSLTGMVHNYGAEEHTFVATLHADGLTRKGEASQPVTVEAGGVQPVVWQVSAERAGPVIVTMGVMAPGGIEDAVELPLEVRERSVHEVVSQSGEFSGEFTGLMALPPNLLPSSTAELKLSRSIGGSMMEGLEYLTGYPYGCVEQTMSRALPNAVVGRALSKLGVDNPGLAEELPALISEGLQRLYGYQHQDGGWGWWYDDATDVYQSAWVVFGLSVTREAGYTVDEKVLQRGAAYLKDQLANSANMDPRTRAYVLYSLARAGYADREATLALAAKVYELDAFSQAGLALALHEIGEKEAALRIVEIMDAQVRVTNGRAFWPTGHDDGYYHSKTMSSDIRTTALALSAYLQVAPDHERITQMVQYLMGERHAQGWGTTNETAFTLLALTDYLLQAEQNAGEIGYEVLLNGKPLTGGTFQPGAPALAIPLPLDQLRAGPNTVTVTQTGEGKLYYTLTGHVYQDLPSVDAAGTLDITRAYLDPETSKPLSMVAMGQLVQVQLTVRGSTSDLSYVMIEDHLPAGFEAINEKLNNASHDASHKEFDEYEWAWMPRDRFQWEAFGYNNKEIRGAAVTFFITTLPGGKEHVITYLARATQTGAFTALPAEISAMYDFTAWGRSASTNVMIGEPVLVE